MLYLIYYYRHKRRTHPELFDKGTGSRIVEASERTALLSNRYSEDDDDEDRSLVYKARACIRHNWISIMAYTLAAIFIVTTGVVSWISTGKHQNLPREDEAWNTPGQAVGWISAFLYLGSRIPQIIKNTETKCQGLSLMMFCFRLATHSFCFVCQVSFRLTHSPSTAASSATSHTAEPSFSQARILSISGSIYPG